jgi:hypothetical protein
MSVSKKGAAKRPSVRAGKCVKNRSNACPDADLKSILESLNDARACFNTLYAAFEGNYADLHQAHKSLDHVSDKFRCVYNTIGRLLDEKLRYATWSDES